MNKLYFADNLEIMREMEDGFVDLIATDPPFNSGHNYQAYTDTWQWDTEAEMAYQELLLVNGQIGNTIEGVRKFLNETPMMAYLVMMATRLVEMHRILRDTGSIYLHCDPSASHYLKLIMDAIWDQNNFRNEIIWSYQGSWIQPPTKYPRRHDTLLFYTKSANYKFNLLYEDNAEEQVNYQRWRKYLNGNIIYGRNMPTQDTRFKTYLNRFVKEHGREPNDDDTVLEITGSRIGTVQYVKVVDPKSSQYLNYPTQKPRALYERIIKASSNEGDLILDPFCGCGTTLEAAHKLGRSWIGIDLNIIALDPIRQRMAERHSQDNEPLQPHKHYEIIGYPTNMQ